MVHFRRDLRGGEIYRVPGPGYGIFGPQIGIAPFSKTKKILAPTFQIPKKGLAPTFPSPKQFLASTFQLPKKKSMPLPFRFNNSPKG